MFPTAYQVLPASDRTFQLLAATANVTESPSTVNNPRLVFNGDILLLAFFSLFVLWNLRCAFARFSCLPEGLQGHMLWSANPNKWRDRPRVVPSTQSSAEKCIGKNSKRSHLPHPVQDRRPPTTPTHAAAIPSILYPIVSPFARRIIPGFSAGKAVILAVYGIILQYESFYKSNLFTDPIRTGFVGTAQIPFVFALATKNNCLGSLVGLGYEKVII